MTTTQTPRPWQKHPDGGRIRTLAAHGTGEGWEVLLLEWETYKHQTIYCAARCNPEGKYVITARHADYDKARKAANNLWLDDKGLTRAEDRWILPEGGARL